MVDGRPSVRAMTEVAALGDHPAAERTLRRPAGPDATNDVAGARIAHFARGEVILDAFTVPSTEVFVVIAGSVDIWNTLQHSDNAADERLGPGGIFGFSAMLIGRSVGPLAVAADCGHGGGDPGDGRRTRLRVQHRCPIPRRAGRRSPGNGSSFRRTARSMS